MSASGDHVYRELPWYLDEYGYSEVEDEYEYRASEDEYGYSSNSDDEYVYSDDESVDGEKVKDVDLSFVSSLEKKSPSTRSLGSSSLLLQKIPSVQLEEEEEEEGSEDQKTTKRRCFGPLSHGMQKHRSDCGPPDQQDSKTVLTELPQLPPSEKDRKPTVSELICKSLNECGIVCPSHETLEKLKMIDMKQRRPSKQEWLDTWYQNGSPKWSVPANDMERVFYTINVYGYYRREIGGYGVILRDDLGRPIVASFGISDGGPVSFLVHEFQGVRGGLQHVIEYELVANRIEVLCKAQTTVEVLKLISWKAADIVEADSAAVWETIWRCFPSSLHFLFEGFFRPLIKEISKLYLQLPHTPEIDAVDVDKYIQRAAEYVAKLGTADKYTHGAAEYAAKMGTADMTQKRTPEQLGCFIVTMKHGEYPEKLQDILFQDAYKKGIMGYTKRPTWDKIVARRG